LKRLIERSAAIGYEPQIKEAFVVTYAAQSEPVIDLDAFNKNPDAFTIVDVRNNAETREQEIFKNSISIPLPELRNRFLEIPTGKPIVVHCAGGYRSAAGSSIVGSALNGKVKVFDLSEAVKQFQPAPVK
jgi:hydroxyacylglutathione hydrolase